MKSFILRRLLGHERYGRHIGVTIGRGCRVLSSNFGTEPFLIEIGDRVTISFDVVFTTHDGASWLIRDDKGRRFIYRPVKIGSDCFIGARAILMPGIEIEDFCIVAAGAVVTKSVPSGSVVGGMPARIIDSFENYKNRTLDMPSEMDLEGCVNVRDRASAALDHRPKPFLSVP